MGNLTWLDNLVLNLRGLFETIRTGGVRVASIRLSPISMLDIFALGLAQIITKLG